VITLLSLLACGDEEPAPYQDFKDVFEPVLVMNAGDVPGKGETLQVFVHPERAGVCRPLPKLTANVDGVPLTRLHGKVPGEKGYDRDCMVYEFTADAETLAKRTAGPDATVTVTDGVTSISGSAKNLFGPRVLEQDGPIGADRKLRLRWVPGGDRVDPAMKPALELKGGFKTQLLKPPELVLTPEAVEVVLPAEVSGAFTAEFTGTLSMQPSTTACTGAHRCEATRVYVVEPVKLTL
jgi:hypothetical protein